MNDDANNYKKIIDQQKKDNPQYFRYLLKKDKDIIGPFLGPNLEKVFHDGYFSDFFTKSHSDKKHLLFAGCSITAGCGVDNIKKSWSFKLYEDINKKEECSGYFNVSLSGGSPIEILLNVFKYIAKHSDPDYIFILFSNYGRDWNKFNTNDGRDGKVVDIFLYNLYSILEDYCKNKNIKLITTSWVDTVPGVTDFIHLDIHDYEINTHNSMKDSFNTYYQINNKRFADNTFKYIQDADTYMTIIGTDGSHPSEAVHHAWYKEFLYRMDDVNVNNGN
ncbi:SGNH_hydrolase domain containing protein [uncultured Caudovirales phage]|uniref:SGNH_hydrolase domain containing protein n=1 Tax=uncultured Caudovirales phage TaxID=2100421 RepID=A0A6J5P6G4_9CAUD|nr:SGNH_hydrolase domain containing protein [uncultured Caudovirales phage]